MTLDIRPMSLRDLEVALGWARDEGWNPGRHDAPAFHAQDPSGFLMGWLGDEPVGCISVVKYGDRFAFLGLYIVRPEYRGKGYGKAIWEAGIASAGDRTIGLDGVPAQQANYERMGFVKAYETSRLAGLPPPARGASFAVDASLRPAVAALDRECFPAPRDRFLAAWLSPPRIVRAVVEGGSLMGYGVTRECIEGVKVGPLYARSIDAALGLLSALSRETGGPVQIDVPVAQEAFTRALTGAGMTPGFSTARMYRGRPPIVEQSQVFGISTLELG
jgi:GNAT superfamily N-acetyltransferase